MIQVITSIYDISAYKLYNNLTATITYSGAN